MNFKKRLIFLIFIPFIFSHPLAMSLEELDLALEPSWPEELNIESEQSWTEWTQEKVSHGLERAQYVVNNIILNTVVYASGGAAYVFLLGRPPEMSRKNLRSMRPRYFLSWITFSVASGGIVRMAHAYIKDTQNDGLVSYVPGILLSQGVRKFGELITMIFFSRCSKNAKMPIYILAAIGGAGFVHSGHSLSKQDLSTRSPVFDTFLSKEYLPMACSLFRGSLKELMASFDSDNTDINQSAQIKAVANAIVGSFKKINDFGLNTETYNNAPLFYSLFENTLIEFVAPFLTIPLQNFLNDSSELKKEAFINVISGLFLKAQQ
jgi:hypothetical protein